MKEYKTNRIKNLALVGHSDSGKTSLAEALLYQTGQLDRRGKVEDKNTVSDYHKVEKDRGISTSLSLIPVEYDDYKVNLIDTPGYFDFEAELLSAIRASEAALMVIDAQKGIEVGTEKIWSYCEKISLPRLIFVNKLEKENVNFNKVVSDLHIEFGAKVVPLTITLGEGDTFTGIIDVINKKAYEYDGYKRKEVEIPEIRLAEVEEVYNKIEEVVADTDDELMEKYFSEEAFTEEEFSKGISEAILDGKAVPLIAGSVETGAGLDILLDTIIRYMPSPDDEKANLGFRTEEGTERHPVSDDAPFSGVVFKTLLDPFIGKISLVKISSGKLTPQTKLKNLSKNVDSKPGTIFFMKGKEQIETSSASAGDIVAISKLDETETGDTLSDEKNKTTYKRVEYPKPNIFFAIQPVSKTDEEKIGNGLNKLQEEDLSFTSERSPETRQLTIGGQGNVQLEVMLERLKEEYGVSVDRVDLKIPYKETIRGNSDVRARHKKQSGGAGQFGDVAIRFEPSEEHFVFDEEIFGGAVPRNYFPAVEKGLEESMAEGVLAGYPVTGIKATLYDGSYHPVDSNEMAFKIAASQAFKQGIEQANPVILEPVMELEIRVDEANLGDVMGDLNKRRGRILGMDSDDSGNQILKAEAPYSELVEYSIDLRSMTHGQGDFSMEFIRYDQVPHEQIQEIIKEAQKES